MSGRGSGRGADRQEDTRPAHLRGGVGRGSDNPKEADNHSWNPSNNQPPLAQQQIHQPPQSSPQHQDSEEEEEEEEVVRMSAPVFGNFEPFKADGIISWDVWQARLEQTFIMNDITTDAKKKACLLTYLGDDSCKVLWSLCAPTLPTAATVTYENCCTKMKDHFVPTKLEIAERQKFYTRKQKMDESIAEFEAALRQEALECNFGDFLEQALRDSFVFNVHDERIYKKLMGTDKLTFANALKTASAMEAVTQQSQRGQAEAAALVNSIGREKEKVDRPANVNHVKNGSRPSGNCGRCGSRSHRGSDCTHLNSECYRCMKIGHLKKVCRAPQHEVDAIRSRSSQQQQQSRGRGRGQQQQQQQFRRGFGRGNVRYVAVYDDDDHYYYDQDEVELNLYSVSSEAERPFLTDVYMDGKKVQMEIDTGCAVSLIPEGIWRRLKRPKLRKVNARLKSYTGQLLEIKGQFETEVEAEGATQKLPVLVVEGTSPALFGRNWLRRLQLNWNKILNVKAYLPSDINKVFRELFKPGLGKYNGGKVHLDLKEGAQPVFRRARNVPYSVKDEGTAIIKRYEASEGLVPVTHSQWASPVVYAVKPSPAPGTEPKPGNKYRLCGDFKESLNPQLKTDTYPLPRPEDLFATLEGCKFFTKLDMSDAYMQLELDEESQELCVINTHLGLRKYTRLPFGVVCAGSKFQRVMDDLFRDLPWVKCYLDDLLVGGRTLEEHWERVMEVLRRLEAAGFRLKIEKCFFGLKELLYLGYIISGEGLKPDPNKVKAINELKTPEEIRQLRAGLGLVNYYGKFIPKLSHEAAPLNRLLKKGEAWRWKEEQETAWRRIKALLVSSEVLCSYNPDLPLKLSCDASSYGVAAVLAHVFPDKTERPIAYASKALSQAEKNYSQLDKEALSIIFGVKRFHSYIYGRKFTLVTDHRPLLSILGPKSGIPPIAAARLQRWSMILAAYIYDLEFCPTDSHGNADALSRFPMKSRSDSAKGFPASTLYHVEFFEDKVTAEDVRFETSRDPLLSLVVSRLKNGWKEEDSTSPELAPFHRRQLEMSLSDGVVLWGSRVVIPKKLRRAVLMMLHEAHSGVVRMKCVARESVWWPKIDDQIYDWVAACRPCQENRDAPPQVKGATWQIPKDPWTRVHADFAGPVDENKKLLVMADATTKWPEVHVMTSTAAPATIQAMESSFCRLGYPERLVTDNGPPFSSKEFGSYAKKSGIDHRMGAPYHPSSNGLAENMVRSVKKSLKRMGGEKIPLKSKINKFLLHYRTTPHTTTGISPANGMFGRQLRGRMQLLRPVEKQTQPETEGLFREFRPGQAVLARDYRKGAPKWHKATIDKRLGTLLYSVKAGDVTAKRHADQLLPLRVGVVDDDEWSIPEENHQPPQQGPVLTPVQQDPEPVFFDQHPHVEENEPVQAEQPFPAQGEVRPLRTHRLPRHLDQFVVDIPQRGRGRGGRRARGGRP